MVLRVVAVGHARLLLGRRPRFGKCFYVPLFQRGVHGLFCLHWLRGSAVLFFLLLERSLLLLGRWRIRLVFLLFLLPPFRLTNSSSTVFISFPIHVLRVLPDDRRLNDMTRLARSLAALVGLRLIRRRATRLLLLLSSM